MIRCLFVFHDSWVRCDLMYVSARCLEFQHFSILETRLACLPVGCYLFIINSIVPNGRGYVMKTALEGSFHLILLTKSVDNVWCGYEMAMKIWTQQPWWTICVHPGKLTCPLKRDYFSREYIFQPLIFRGHVSFPGSNFVVPWFQTWPSRIGRSFTPGLDVWWTISPRKNTVIVVSQVRP